MSAARSKHLAGLFVNKMSCFLLQSFLRGETQIPKDEAFKECIESYLHVFLKSERVAQIVGGGALSQHDCREVFRHQSEKRIRQLPEIDGLSKDTVVTSWMAKYDALMKGTIS